MDNIIKKKNTFSKIKSFISWVLLIVLALSVALILTTRINGNTPSIAGYSIYRISSGSMEPALKVGDVILVKECSANEIKVDDIVTFQGANELQGKIITHRVIKEAYLDDGKYYFQTKGDARPVGDEDSPTPAENLYGKMVSRIPWLNYLYNFFLTPWGLATIIVLILLAFADDIIRFFKALLGVGLEETKNEDINDIIARIQSEETDEK